MTKTLVLYVVLEALLSALFAVVIATQGMSVWAYWTMAGLFVLNLLLGVALLTKGKGRSGR